MEIKYLVDSALAHCCCLMTDTPENGTQTLERQKLAANKAVCAWERDCVPVRMFWKASSTLLASRADVSMKERLFSPATNRVSIWEAETRNPASTYLRIAWPPRWAQLSDAADRSCFQPA